MGLKEGFLRGFPFAGNPQAESIQAPLSHGARGATLFEKGGGAKITRAGLMGVPSATSIFISRLS
jgi:hypothetical protein